MAEMETQELIKKVRKVEIKTRGLSKQLFSGEYHSAFKGRGMSFSEAREYTPGDDVRSIDWNVTARTGTPHVKIFEEERELTVMLLADVSESENFGSKSQVKKELITELCAVLSFSAIQNNDKIGLILFSDKVEKYIPPKKGKSHILRIIRELIEFKSESKKTNIAVALEFLLNVAKKRCITFVISDFISPEFMQPLRIVSKKHDTIATMIFDQREAELPNIGLIKIQDAETGNLKWLDTGSTKVRAVYNKQWRERISNLEKDFNRSNADLIKIEAGNSYIAPLRQFFKERDRKRSR